MYFMIPDQRRVTRGGKFTYYSRTCSNGGTRRAVTIGIWKFMLTHLIQDPFDDEDNYRWKGEDKWTFSFEHRKDLP